ncbi:MAG: hypothetical protein WBF37_12540 [Dehalococcoidia bacterium]
MRFRLWHVLLFAGALLLSAGCGGGATQPAPSPPSGGAAVSENLFLNPDFEEGEQPWFSMTTQAWGPPFEVSGSAADSENQSALLQMRAGPEAAGARVFGVVQEITPEHFPELVSGYYRVEDWARGAEKQYVQFVVIVFEASNTPVTSPNHQIRYLLAGIEEPPFSIGNARFVFVGTDEPVTGQWVYFERNIRDDFQELWGAVPEGFSKIRILLEVRYDDKAAGSGEVKADVFYDDLYVGPAAANPNRPEE